MFYGFVLNVPPYIGHPALTWICFHNINRRIFTAYNTNPACTHRFIVICPSCQTCSLLLGQMQCPLTITCKWDSLFIVTCSVLTTSLHKLAWSLHHLEGPKNGYMSIWFVLMWQYGCNLTSINIATRFKVRFWWWGPDCCWQVLTTTL
jgi:hypothetical protein